MKEGNIMSYRELSAAASRIDRAAQHLLQQRRLKKNARIVWTVMRTIFILGFAFVILYPVLSMVSKAFMMSRDLYDTSVIWIPKHWTLENLSFAWDKMQFPASFSRSLIFTLLATVLQTFVCLMAGYAFARYDFPLKNALFALVILSILIPPQQILTPLYLHLIDFDLFGLVTSLRGSGLNLTTTRIPFFLVSMTGFGLRNGLYIFLFRQFFRGIPRETEEAALVDGAGSVRIFLQIMIPGAVSIIVTVMLFSFVWQWNDMDYASVLLPNERMLPQAFDIFNTFIKEYKMSGGESTVSVMQKFDLSDYKVLAMLRSAGVLLVMFPLMLVYLAAQRFFVESIDRSGLVG